MAVMALSLVACKDKNEPSDAEKTSSSTPGDNGGNGDISGTGVKNEFGEGRLIIGYWKTNYSAGTNYYFTFYSDGTCHSEYGSSYDGYWSYDPETKMLSTTENYIGSMKINIMTPKALQGTTTGGKNYGLTHNYDSSHIDKNPKLLIGKWANEDNTKEYVFDGTNYTLTENGNKQTGTYDIQISLDPNKPSRVNEATITIGGTTYQLRNLQGGYFSYYQLGGDLSSHEEYYYVSE